MGQVQIVGKIKVKNESLENGKGEESSEGHLIMGKGDMKRFVPPGD